MEKTPGCARYGRSPNGDGFCGIYHFMGD